MEESDISLMLVDSKEYKKEILRLKAENAVSKRKIKILESRLNNNENNKKDVIM